MQYQFNSIGNLVHRTNISIDETFGYDSRNQLTSINATVGGNGLPQLTVEYDALGRKGAGNDS